MWRCGLRELLGDQLSQFAWTEPALSTLVPMLGNSSVPGDQDRQSPMAHSVLSPRTKPQPESHLSGVSPAALPSPDLASSLLSQHTESEPSLGTRNNKENLSTLSHCGDSSAPFRSLLGVCNPQIVCLTLSESTGKLASGPAAGTPHHTIISI